jgi:hypothetical protein
MPQVLNIHNLFKTTKGELKIMARRKGTKERNLGFKAKNTKRQI